MKHTRAIFAAVAIACVANAGGAAAQAPAAATFRPGDRAQEYLGGTWHSGTITGPLAHNAYPFVRDEMAGTGLSDQVTPDALRPLNNGSKRPKVAVAPKQRAPIKCPAPVRGTKGAPSSALAHRLIQCLWEDTGSDMSVVNFDIHSLHVDSPRAFVVGHDMGNANQETTVYPVTASWTKKTFGTSSVLIANEQGLHKCYVDLGGVWVCGYENSRNLTPLQRILR